MKLFDVDWPAVLDELARWTVLDAAARRTALDHLKPSGNVAADVLGPHRDAILRSGIARLDAAGRRAVVCDDARELVRVLRAMDRRRVFDEPMPVELLRYLEEHFTNEEVQRLGGWRTTNWGQGTRPQLAARVGFEAWTGDLLAATSDAALLQWAVARGATLMQPPEESLLLLRGVQALAGTLLDRPDGIPLRDLVLRARDGVALDALGAPDPGDGLDALDAVEELGVVLHAALGFAVILGGLRGADLEPMVGLWPPAARELRRPPAQPPPVVAPVETFELAPRLEDMTTVVAAAAAQPLRLRANDLAVFARTRRIVDAQLATLPPWTGALLPLDAEERVRLAVAEGLVAGLVQVRRGAEPYLMVTKAGERWLAQTPRDRLAAVLDPMRRSKERNPPTPYEATASRFFPYTLPFFRPPPQLDLRAALARAFRTEGFVPLGPFLDYHARADNPLLAVDRRELGLHVHGGDPQQFLRRMWHDMLAGFLVDRLAAFGGVRLGRAGDDALAFALTDVGRYLLGAAGDFAYGAPEVADIVVQPNFDVVFLAPAPAAEAAVARFAERVGRAPGVAFRITHASVLAAAQGGATRDDLLGVLRGASSRPLPANVEREIGGWLAAVRRASVRTAVLLECPDDDTATRVVAVLGARARRLAPTVFELAEAAPAARRALLRKLHAAGVFLDEGAVEPDVGIRRTRRRR